MKTVANILFVQWQAVGRVPLEVVPDLLGRVEFRGVLGVPLWVQTGGVLTHPLHRGPLVDFTLVPPWSHSRMTGPGR